MPARDNPAAPRHGGKSAGGSIFSSLTPYGRIVEIYRGLLKWSTGLPTMGRGIRQKCTYLPFSTPRGQCGVALLGQCVAALQPDVVVFDARQRPGGINDVAKRALAPYAFWKWNVNNSALCGAQSCLLFVNLRIVEKIPTRGEYLLFPCFAYLPPLTFLSFYFQITARRNTF